MVGVGPPLIDAQVLLVVDGNRFQAPRARSAVIVVQVQFGPVAVSAQGGPVGDRSYASGERARDCVDCLDARRLGLPWSSVRAGASTARVTLASTRVPVNL